MAEIKRDKRKKIVLFTSEVSESEKKSSVKDLPKHEKPREKLLTKGTSAMSDFELLAIMLRTGIKNHNVLEFSQRLLSHFGSLEKLFEASLQDLMEIKGIGLAKGAELISCITLAKRYRKEKDKNEILRLESKPIQEASAAVTLIRDRITDYSKEQFFIMNLDVRNRIIDLERISEGTLTASLVHPRETFASAIRKHAASVMVAHNHPSGDTQPSEEDIRITRRLKDAGNIIGIQLLDHIIITEHKHCSLKEMGII